MTANPLEGALVKVNGPLKVARIESVSIGNNGLYAGTNWLLVNNDGSAPGDSILIDGYTLTASNILHPPLGYIVDWVQGILRRATNDGVDCWIVTLRDANDQSVRASPAEPLGWPTPSPRTSCASSSTPTWTSRPRRTRRTTRWARPSAAPPWTWPRWSAGPGPSWT